MLAVDRKSLVCDLAETYGIFDFESVSPRLVGTLAAGLGANSRIGMELNGVDGTTVEFLLAELIDSVNTLTYCLFGKKESEPPESRKAMLFKDYRKEEKEEEKEYESFETGEDFETRRAELIGGEKHV